MPIPVFPPRKDSELLSWSANFDTKITASPTTYGLNALQATEYGNLHSVFADAYALVVNPNTNSKANIIAKNAAKDTLLNSSGGAKVLVDIVQAYPNTTDVMRGELGLRIPAERTPIPAPPTAPDLSIVCVTGRAIKVRLRDVENPDRRGKPDGVTGAIILYHVSETTPPSDPGEWTFVANTSRTTVDVEIPASVPAGSKVWLTAFWFNNRKDSSPAAAFESVRISEGLAQAA